MDTVQAGPQTFNIEAIQQNIICRCNIYYNAICTRNENTGLDVVRDNPD